jgi:hypothetical protein
MNIVSMKKPFTSKEKPLPFGIPINARQPVITPDALMRMMCGSRTGGWSLHCVMSD